MSINFYLENKVAKVNLRSRSCTAQNNIRDGRWRGGKRDGRVYRHSASNGNRSRISSPLGQISCINLGSSSGSDICKSSFDAGIVFLYITGNVDALRNLDQARPSGAWWIGLLGTGRNCTAGCCGAGVHNCGACPGLQGASQVDGLGDYYGVGSDCHPARGLDLLVWGLYCGRYPLTAGSVMV